MSEEAKESRNARAEALATFQHDAPKEEVAEKTAEREERLWKARTQIAVNEIERTNRQRLDEIYEEEFHPDDPPESYRRFEREQTLRRLTEAVHRNVGGTILYTKTPKSQPDTAARRSYATTDTERIAIVESEENPTPVEGEEKELGPEVAERAIELIGTYGEQAEPYLAALAGSLDIPAEYREQAQDELERIRREGSGSDSLREALGRWLLSSRE